MVPAKNATRTETSAEIPRVSVTVMVVLPGALPRMVSVWPVGSIVAETTLGSAIATVTAPNAPLMTTLVDCPTGTWVEFGWSVTGGGVGVGLRVGVGDSDGSAVSVGIADGPADG